MIPKKLYILVVLTIIIFAGQVHAKKETNTFSVGESYVFDDKNITVIQIDEDRDKVIVCVNNAKGIVDESKQINDVYLTIKSASGNSAKIDMTYTCNDNDDDCRCNGVECSNDRCVSKVSEVSSSPDITDNSPTIVKPKPVKPSIPTSNAVQEVRVVRSVEKSGSSGVGIVFAVLLLIVIVLAVLSLIKKKENN